MKLLDRTFDKSNISGSVNWNKETKEVEKLLGAQVKCYTLNVV